MKANVIFGAFFFLCLVSCRSPKAEAFKEAVVQKERVAFGIILDKNGPETKKLECLVKNDYKCALQVVDQQAKEFDKLITDLEGLKADDFKEGQSLKYTALNYYKALKALHFFDRKEIEQQILIHEANNHQLKMGQDSLIELARRKKSLYTKVYEQEILLSTAFKKFDIANGL